MLCTAFVSDQAQAPSPPPASEESFQYHVILLHFAECLSMPYGIHASFALVSCFVFAVCAMLLTMADHELEPMCKSLLGASNSMTELATMALKTVITVSDITLRATPRFQCVLFVISTFLIVYLHIRQVRCGGTIRLIQ